MEITARIAALIEQGRKAKCNAIQVFASVVGTRTAVDDLVTTKPLDAAIDGLADHIAQEILDELEERHGPVRFRLKVIKQGAEIMRETLRLEGRANPPRGMTVVRGSSTSSHGALVHQSEGTGPATAQIGTEDLLLPDGAMSGTASTAVVLSVLRMQMQFNRDLSRDFLSLVGASHKPLMDQNAMLADALGKANAQIIASAEQHRESVRQTRVLEAEARTEERKAAAIEKAGEMLAKYLPAAIARISRRFGLVAPDEENDPLLEKLVLSFKSSQMAQMQKILEPEQIALFADVWASIDDRRGKKGKKKGPHPWSAALPAIEKLLRSLSLPQLGALAVALTPEQAKLLEEIQATTKLLPASSSSSEASSSSSASSSAPASGVVPSNGANGNGHAHANGNGKAAAS